jgi:hypothetical protein
MRETFQKIIDRESADAEEILNCFPRMFEKVAITPLTLTIAAAKCPA